MKTPSSAEWRLIALLATALFLVANVFLLRLYFARVHEATARLTAMHRTSAEYQDTISQHNYWAARQEWMLRVPPEPFEGSKTEAAFAERIQQSLNAHHLTIAAQKLNESRPEGPLVITDLELSLKADLEPLVRWLHHVQQPGNYLSVDALNLRLPDGESSVLAQVRISRISLIPAATARNP